MEISEFTITIYLQAKPLDRQIYCVTNIDIASVLSSQINRHRTASKKMFSPTTAASSQTIVLLFIEFVNTRAEFVKNKKRNRSYIVANLT